VAELTLPGLVDEVVRLLTTESGEFPQPYRRRPRLAVNKDAGAAGLEFNLDAVLTGPGAHEGLVTVQMLSPDRLRKTRNEVRALTTWLTRTGSRRPLTLVAITEGSNDNAAPNDQLKVTQHDDQQAVQSLLRELATLCHVLVIELDDAVRDEGDPAIRRQLVSLMPLELPPAFEKRKPAFERLRESVNETAAFQESDLFNDLLKASAKSQDAVAATMKKWIETCISDAREVPHD
jgi:hypothetical protein